MSDRRNLPHTPERKAKKAASYRATVDRKRAEAEALDNWAGFELVPFIFPATPSPEAVVDLMRFVRGKAADNVRLVLE